MLVHDQLKYDTSGRRSMEARMQLVHGDVIVLKAKASIASSILQLTGKTLTPEQIKLVFGSMVYPDWGGEDNMISESSQLLSFETNTASCYLVFKPIH